MGEETDCVYAPDIFGIYICIYNPIKKYDKRKKEKGAGDNMHPGDSLYTYRGIS